MPVAKGRPRFTSKGRAYTPSKTVRAEQDMRFYLGKYFSGPPLECALHIQAIFTFVRPKSVTAKKRPHMVVVPDIDNVLKGLADAANGLVWVDDSQIVRADVAKVYGDVASVFLCVREVK